MISIDTRFERALLALVTAAAVLLVAAPDGGPILSGELLPIAGAVGVAVYASGHGECGDCGCC